MEIIIKGTPKEIAELALELQGRQKKNVQSDDAIQKQIELVSKASESCCNSICNDYDNYNTLASLTNSLVGLCNLSDDFQKNCYDKNIVKKVCIYERISNLSDLENLTIDAFSQSSALLSEIEKHDGEDNIKMLVSDLNTVIKEIRDFEFCIKRNETLI